MKYRQLGNTGITVPEVGLGCWQLGEKGSWRGPGENESDEIVKKALEVGCNFFDTAPNYGHGESEKLLGKSLKGVREKVVINSKCGHWSDGNQNYDAKLIKKSVEESLTRLQTDYLDSLILHSPPQDVYEGDLEHFKIFEQLKKEGKIKAYGASVDTSAEIIKIIENTGSKVIEVMFNIFFQEPKNAFEIAEKNGVGIIVKVPLDSGWLTGKYDKNSTFEGIRSRWSKEDIELRASLVEEVKKIKPANVSMVQEAISFILSFSAISSVIPGARNPEQLVQNLSASDIIMPQENRAKYEKLYVDKVKNANIPW